MGIKNVWERFVGSRMNNEGGESGYRMWVGATVLLKQAIFSKFARALGQVVVFAGIFSLVFWFAGSVISSDNKSDEMESLFSSEDINMQKDARECNVLGINVHGMILTYIPLGNKDEIQSNKDVVSSENVISLIRVANEEEEIEAIVIEIDSMGGTPVAGEEIARAIQESAKPVIGLIRQSGASAGYWAISPANKIFASANSDIGSIGVTASYNQNLDKDRRFIQLSSGKYKDSFNPDKGITEEERRIIMRDVMKVHENFIKAVAENRNLSVQTVRSMADGSTVLGDEAKHTGLIDEIGGLYDVEKALEEILEKKPVICWE